MSSDVKRLLSSAPDSALDASMVEKVKLWSEPPKALEILEVLDLSVFCGLASDLIVTLLQLEYEAALKVEGLTHEQAVMSAQWRQLEQQP